MLEIWLEKKAVIRKILPGIIFIALWMNGWFYPLLLLPFIYVFAVEEETLNWMGFKTERTRESAILGILVSLVLLLLYIPVAFFYLQIMQTRNFTPYDIFTDVIWYPLYEEVVYRSFFLTHFAKLNDDVSSRSNIAANISQAILFTFIHRNHIESRLYFLLVIVFLLAVFTGLLFIRTKNMVGCLIAHATLNAGALFILILIQV